MRSKTRRILAVTVQVLFGLIRQQSLYFSFGGLLIVLQLAQTVQTWDAAPNTLDGVPLPRAAGKLEDDRRRDEEDEVCYFTISNCGLWILVLAPVCRQVDLGGRGCKAVVCTGPWLTFNGCCMVLVGN